MMQRIWFSGQWAFACLTLLVCLAVTPSWTEAQVPSQAQNQAPAAGHEQQPFPALAPQEIAQLQQILAAWEQQSKGTKTLECDFKVWHFDPLAAPAGVPATIGKGVIRYAEPDKGLFRVDSKEYFTGMKEGKPEYAAQEGRYGDHWVCTGEALIEFDRGAKECRFQTLPPHIQGKQIFNSPLPFVFNLDARQIQERYWVRQVESPDKGTILIEAWPKRQADRAQYKVVQIALETRTFAPRMLRMFAPNFNEVHAPEWHHYEFANVKRNSVGAGITQFLKTFIDERPPNDWKVLKDVYQPAADEMQGGAQATAQAPTQTPNSAIKR
jgi:TIGR03009 family protein